MSRESISPQIRCRSTRGWAGAALLVACGLATSCPGAGSEGRPNVILITVDTLRADHLACYGYELAITPHLDALAGRATLHRNAVATAPWTAPTHASLFTGLHPFEHGAISFETDRPSRNVHSLDEAHVTLAEVLRDEGYATGAIVANSIYLDAVFQLGQGFQLWDVKREWGEGVNARAFRWLERREDEPFFLFLNYLDTHRPYNVTPLPGERVYGEEEFSILLLDELYERVMVRGEDPGDLAAFLVEQYDRAVRNVDAAIGRLIERLKELDLYDDTILVVTSDHGEYFGEHGLVEHSKDVYREGLRVPLIVKLPGQTRGEVAETLISSVDVPGLILDALPEGLRRRHGETFRYRPGNHPVIAENHFSRPRDLMLLGDRFHRERTAVYALGFKFIHSTDGNHELYRLGRLEDENRMAEHPDVATHLTELIERLLDEGRWEPGIGAVGELSPELLEEMRKLGYAGGETR